MYKIEFNPLTKVVQKVQIVEAPESFVRTPGVIYAETDDIDSLGLVKEIVHERTDRAGENYWTELITKDNISEYISNTVVDLDKRYLKKTEEDTAQKLIHFTEGLRSSGDVRSEEYLFKTKGYKIDKDGNADMKSLILREFLEVPEIRFNRITVVGGEFWLTDGAIILTATPVSNVSNGYALTFKLEENDTQPFQVGDLIKGIHQEFNEAGDYQGFYTIWMEVVTVSGKNYIEVKVKPQYTGTIKPPLKFLNVARVGNIDPSKTSRQRSIYMSSTEGSITFLDGVNQWDIEPYMVKMCLGNIDKLGDIPGIPQMDGYSAYLKNIISYGKHFEIDEQGNPVPTPIYKGHWNNKIKYQYYDQVTHNGSLWLCTNKQGSVIGDAPDAFDANWSICVSQGQYYETLYTRTNSSTDIPDVPATTESGYQNNNFIKSPWTRNPTGVNLANKYEWVISRKGTEGNWGEFSSPAIYAVYGVDGDTTHFIYKRTSTETAPDTPTVNFSKEGWKEDPVGVNEYNKFEWVSSRHKINESWGSFSAPAIWAKYAIDGEPGKDGKDIEFIFKLTADETAPDKPIGINQDDYIPTGWTDDPTGVSSSSPYEWTCRRLKVDGAWTAYNDPALWSKYSFNGEDGIDGKSVEYIYILKATDANFDAPATSQADDYVPSSWSDDPLGVSPTLPYEFVSKRTKSNNIWSAFSSPKIWAKYSYDGTDGDNGISPTLYNLIPSINVVVINKLGNADPSSFAVVCKKTKQDVTSDSSDLFLAARRSTDGGTYTAVGTISQASSISVATGGGYSRYKVRGYLNQTDAANFNNNFLAETTISAIKDGADGGDGKPGTPGAILRTRGEFVQGESYYYNQIFRDVIFKVFNAVPIVFMVRNYSENPVTVAPSSAQGDSNWEPSTQFKSVATELLLANKADIAGFKFYNDKLISQWGTLNGTAVTVNDLANDTDWNNFEPNLVLNGETGNVNIQGLQTNALATAASGARIDIRGTEMKVFGTAAMNILFGVDDSGMAVLKYYDNNGKFLYDLGPSGIRWRQTITESWTTTALNKLCEATVTNPTWMNLKGVKDGTCIKTVTGWRYSTNASDSSMTKYWYTQKDINSPKIEDGWYIASSSVAQSYPASNTNDFIEPFGADAVYYMDSGGVRDRNPIKYDTATLIIGGEGIETKVVCWNG